MAETTTGGTGTRAHSRLTTFRVFCRVLILLVIWSIAKNAQVVAGFIPKPSICEYNETTGKDSRSFRWTLHQEGQGWLLTSEDQRETHIAWVDATLNTYKWSLDRPEEETSITATRDNNMLRIEGTKDGEAYRQESRLGDTPWYQALSLSLRKHLGEPFVEQEFWSIRPDNFDLNRMQIIKIEEVPLETAKETMDTYHVTIRPAGWKAPFWKGEYWFRKSDGYFVRYCGDSGPPGSPDTVIELNDMPTSPKTNKTETNN